MEADKLHLIVVDGEPGLPAIEGSSQGILYSVDLFRSAIQLAKTAIANPSVVFESKRPSEYMGCFAKGAEARLLSWEEHEYKRKGYNAGGKEACASLRKWKDEERRAPTDTILDRPDRQANEHRYVVAMLEAMVKEWEKMMAYGLSGSL